MKKWVLRIVALTILLSPLAACNTMAGLGQDIKSAGTSLESAARRN